MSLESHSQGAEPKDEGQNGTDMTVGDVAQGWLGRDGLVQLCRDPLAGTQPQGLRASGVSQDPGDA